MKKNDLTGLDLNGFNNQATNFDISNFKENGKIKSIRREIKKYYTKTKGFYKLRTSYGLKHDMEKHIGEYVSNGELIYAMHLEGFKIKRESPNCLFNLSTTGMRLLMNSNDIKNAIKTPWDYEISEYLKTQKNFRKYKYNFNLIIKNIFSGANHLKKDIPKIIGKEINESPENIKEWFNLLKEESETIPKEKLEEIANLFNLFPKDLKNY